MTLSLLKLTPKGSDISISFILKILLSALDVNIEIINKVYKQKLCKIQF